MSKGQLIIDESKNKEEDDKWLVHPSPGFCVKFKNVQFPNCSLQNEIYNKLFINIAHCIEIPPPKQQILSEDEVAQLLATDANAYQIPICVGNLDKVIDNKGKTEIKIDVLMNSNFFHKCINESEFFRQITLQIINETIKSKFGISINICEQIILRNKRCMGQLNAQYIHKRPLNSIMDLGGKINDGKNTKPAVEMNDENATKIDIDDIEEIESGSRKPRNFKAQIIKGQTMEIKIKVKDSDGNSVHQIDRIGIKMNEDRVIILLDSEHIVADFFLPFRIKDEEAICQFNEGTSTITINCPVNWE